MRGQHYLGTMEHPLTIRPALPEDALDLLRWRNDPLVRAMSRTSEPIPEASHLAWYTAACQDPNRLLLVGAVDGAAVGMVRFDRRPPTDWEANIMLAPEARGVGLAKDLLAAGLDRLEASHRVAVVLAAIRHSNTSSIRLFESLGFRLTDADREFRYFRLRCATEQDHGGNSATDDD